MDLNEKSHKLILKSLEKQKAKDLNKLFNIISNLNIDSVDIKSIIDNELRSILEEEK